MRAPLLLLEESTWAQVAALDPARTVVFMLSGPIEQHGPHLPLGSDLFQARLVMEMVASRVRESGWTVVLTPALPYTTAVLSRRFAGSVSVRKSSIVPFFRDVLCSFASNGLVNVVVVSQHLDPPHVLAWEQACHEAARESGARAIEGYERLLFDDLRSGALRDLLGEAVEGDSHAGMIETSIMLAARPDLVASERRRLPPVRLDFDRDLRRARDFRELGNGLGYTGDPAAGDPELGMRLARRYAERFAAIVLDHLRGEDVWDLLSLRSLYPG
ncbi:MAG TPA: creatininase family protein [Candidatus Dormibacteraeota bacterium]|nr:creatininase family protein [Candidatus Dormibacteraeota bacterium]